MGSDGDNKNLLMAIVLSIAVVLVWSIFIVPPPPPPMEPAAAGGQVDAVPAATMDGGAASAVATAPQGQTRGEALASAPRVEIANGTVTGSIALTGARLDDLHLSRYRETLEPGAETVVLLNPAGGPTPYFIDYGWRRTVDSDPGPLPSPATKWTVESGDKLTATTPVVLRWDNGQGLIFRHKFEVDNSYMFTMTQSVENATGDAVSLAPYGVVARRGEPEGVNFYIVHEGAIGMFDGELSEVDYAEVRELAVSVPERGPTAVTAVAENGWLGFTDKYWITSLAPQPNQAFSAVYKMLNLGGIEEFRTEMRLPVTTVAAGATTESVTRLFAGAKEYYTLTGYEEKLGIVDFHKAIDWGWFYFLTKPLFQLLAWVYGLIGNMGVAIIVLTLMVKAVLFPLAYKSYVSMSKMKKLQPEMEKIKERVGDDKQKMQQEMMALYKKEKVNPAAGCLPILLQIPIFFSLYKVLFVTIEMRHAPFVGWIHDLSAPDPTSFMNLFGLFSYEIPAFLALFSIGVYPIVMGVTMWMQQKLNPSPTDPTQKMIFAWMPWVFMFMLGRFASGLVIYWCANNIITFTQQYIIMRSQGIQVDLLGNITSTFKRKPVTAAKEKPAKEAGDEPKTAPDATPSDRAPAQKRSRKRRQAGRAGTGGAAGGGAAGGGDGSGGAPRKSNTRDDGSSAGDGGGDGGGGNGGGGGD